MTLKRSKSPSEVIEQHPSISFLAKIFFSLVNGFFCVSEAGHRIKLVHCFAFHLKLVWHFNKIYKYRAQIKMNTQIIR